jgi:glycosyltransferase involved in cell wall biosynthesis
MESVANRDLSVIIPAFNESAALAPLLQSLAEELPGAEILVIDDGSSDDTAEVAAAHGARVVSHAYNIGNGAAVKTGLRNASRPYVVLMDADGQHQAKDIRKLAAHLPRYNMVVGERPASGQAGWHRWLANTIYNRLASYVSEFPVRDLTSGFRAMRTSEVRRYLEILPNTFSYPTTLTLAYLRSGLTLRYEEIDIRRRVGTSKIRIWQDGTRFLLILTKIATLFAPFRVFLPVSVGFFVTGATYYLYTFITAHRFTNMAALLLSTSVVIFMLGLVSEQISLMRSERIEAAHVTKLRDAKASSAKPATPRRAKSGAAAKGSAATGGAAKAAKSPSA